eukprot:764933-Rhodomonas_salina.1
MEDEHQDLFDFLIPLSPSKRKAENNNDESQHKRQKNEIQNQENIATKERHNEVNKEKTEIPKKKRTYKKREKKTALHHIQSALENVFSAIGPAAACTAKIAIQENTTTANAHAEKEEEKKKKMNDCPITRPLVLRDFAINVQNEEYKIDFTNLTRKKLVTTLQKNGLI